MAVATTMMPMTPPFPGHGPGILPPGAVPGVTVPGPLAAPLAPMAPAPPGMCPGGMPMGMPGHAGMPAYPAMASSMAMPTGHPMIGHPGVMPGHPALMSSMPPRHPGMVPGHPGMLGTPGAFPPVLPGFGSGVGYAPPLLDPLAKDKDGQPLPLCPPMSFWRSLPQPYHMDTDPRDGPISVAAEESARVVGFKMQRPCPETRQYPFREESAALERRWLPRAATEFHGFVQASVNPKTSLWDPSEAHVTGDYWRQTEVMSILSWNLQLWKSEEEFMLGGRGGLRAPQPLAAWDLRTAHDVSIEVGDIQVDEFPYRVCVHCKTGCVFFRVTNAREVALWYDAIRRVIQDAFQGQIERCDTGRLQERRWICAVGLMSYLRSDTLSDLALEAVFHAYDFDYDNQLQTGEIMLLLQECIAADFHLMNYADCQERDTAMASTLARITMDDIYDRAMIFRRRCDDDGNGSLRKDEFCRHAQAALLEAIDNTVTDHTDSQEPPRPSQSQDVCASQ